MLCSPLSVGVPPYLFPSSPLFILVSQNQNTTTKTQQQKHTSGREEEDRSTEAEKAEEEEEELRTTFDHGFYTTATIGEAEQENQVLIRPTIEGQHSLLVLLPEKRPTTRPTTRPDLVGHDGRFV